MIALQSGDVLETTELKSLASKFAIFSADRRSGITAAETKIRGLPAKITQGPVTGWISDCEQPPETQHIALTRR